MNSAKQYSRFTKLITRLGYEPNAHVVESGLASGLAYVIRGDLVGIVTLRNGSLTMPLVDFQKVVKEADEVFRFWTGG